MVSRAAVASECRVMFGPEFSASLGKCQEPSRSCGGVCGCVGPCPTLPVAATAAFPPAGSERPAAPAPQPWRCRALAVPPCQCSGSVAPAHHADDVAGASFPVCLSPVHLRRGGVCPGPRPFLIAWLVSEGCVEEFCVHFGEQPFNALADVSAQSVPCLLILLGLRLI